MQKQQIFASIKPKLDSKINSSNWKPNIIEKKKAKVWGHPYLNPSNSCLSSANVNTNMHLIVWLIN